MSPKKSTISTQNKQWMIYAILIAIIAWTIFIATTLRMPVNNMSKILFFASLFVGISCTLMPAIGYLNVRFGRSGSPRLYRFRAIRQSGLTGLLVVFVAWLQMLRVLNITITLILLGVLVLIEAFLLTRDTTSGH